ncbi:hypothetical protein LCGC14_2981400 [marine sediment metagenome]|uniref:Uncharacterized protein n=1 Tax=marine sediment metagenome TaxID=412755 RepID=A0A0F8X6F1_9ZZZZ
MNKYHNIERIDFEGNIIILEVDGKIYKFELGKCSSKLLNASEEQRTNYEISPSGYGIDRLMIDEDLSIDGLLGVKHTISSGKKAS